MWIILLFMFNGETAPEPVKVETCFYTNTDDDRFILERHDTIVVGSACSGHSFKFAPAVGKRLAGLNAPRGDRPAARRAGSVALADSWCRIYPPRRRAAGW